MRRLAIAGAFFGVMMGISALAGAQSPDSIAPMGSMSMGHDGHMSGHMMMSATRPVKPGDQEKADQVAGAAKAAIEPYKDYRKALADGFEIFLPNLPQKMYHFTDYQRGIAAARQ